MSDESPQKPVVVPKVESEDSGYEVLPAEVVPAEAAPKPKLEGPRFIDTVDDDADLSDPETERMVRGGSPLSRENTMVSAAAAGAFVEAGRGDAAIVAAVGAGVCVGAGICAAVFATGPRFPAAVLALLDTAVLTATGVVAVGVTAHLVGRSFGDVLLGVARVFLAVALLMLGVWMDLPIPGRWVEPLVGAGLYMGAMWWMMRRSWRDIGKVAVLHFVLSVVVLGGLYAFAWATSATGAKP